jgi:hypothetical protein
MGMSNSLTPIHSSLDDRPELRDSISDFVVVLAEKVDSLQDTESSGDLPLLEKLADELGRMGTALGYACLTVQTEQIQDACARDKPELAQAALVELTALSRRIRLGHRGSA